MIYAIRGRLVHSLEQTIVVEDVSGLSWELLVSSLTREDLSANNEEFCQVYTWLYHREDAMLLYGFSTLDEKELFMNLIKVNGIGPKQSIKILSMARPSELASAIVGEDESFLHSLPGIGAKGAKKIIIALKDTLTDIAQFSDSPVITGGVPRNENLLQALCDMGFDRKRAKQALVDVLISTDPDDEGEVLRRAIIELS